jgi:threonine dehydratase
VALVVTVVTATDVDEATRRIAGHVRETPVLALEPGAFGSRGSLVLKLELLLHAGSFKPRGAFNRVLAARVPSAGVVAASGGNHGVAVAHVARSLGHRAEISCLPSARRPRSSGFGRSVPPSPSAAPCTRTLRRGDRAGGRDRRRSCTRTTTRSSSPGRVDAREPTGGAGDRHRADRRGRRRPHRGAAAWFGDRVRIVSVEPASIPAMYEAAGGPAVTVSVSGLAADFGARRLSGRCRSRWRPRSSTTPCW